jgi:hypothetical protein
MVSLMTKAKPAERQRWHRYFNRLSAIEKDRSITEPERGQAFVDLIEEARPKLPTRGRPREDVSGLLSDLDTIVGLLAPAWPKGTAARKAALAGVERMASVLKLEREGVVQKNPAKLAMGMKVPPRPPANYMTKAERDKVLTVLSGRDSRPGRRNYAMFSLMFCPVSASAKCVSSRSPTWTWRRSRSTSGPAKATRIAASRCRAS